MVGYHKMRQYGQRELTVVLGRNATATIHTMNQGPRGLAAPMGVQERGRPDLSSVEPAVPKDSVRSGCSEMILLRQPIQADMRSNF